MGPLSQYTVLLGILLLPGLTPQYGLDPTSNPQYLEYVFDRPMEPIFMPKGIHENIVFKLPEEYLPSRFLPIAADIEARGRTTANAIQITVPRFEMPDLSLPEQLDRREHFSNFIPFHRRMAHSLIEIFLRAPTYEEFLSLAVYCRPRINPYLYVYALSIAILHRPDTRDVRLPLHISLFPEKYFSGEIFGRLREQATVVPLHSRIPIEIPRDYTASDLEPEHRLAYFREDVGINLNHWHWHLSYPSDGPVEIVNKDRRGELFYYYHAQIVARYNFERLSNKLSRVQRLINWNEPIKEGYFPKLDSLIASRVWPPRQGNSVLQDISREDQRILFDIQDLERWRDRVFAAIHTGRVRNERGQNVPLTPEQGTNILGNILESSILSVNRNYYGDLHHLGHVALAYVHDPDNRHLEPFSVMGDITATMRDPVFYRWHAFLNDIFLEHKNTLPRYNNQELSFEGISITDFRVVSEGDRLNEFSTFWQQSDIDLSRGLDFAPGGPLLVRVTHLQHHQFSYLLQVDNAGSSQVATVRIFMAPKFDERGSPLLLQDQKSLFIELDKFQVTLLPGRNVIKQASIDSSVTIPYEYTFRDLSLEVPGASNATGPFNFYGCGWPHHMLIPKGNPEGLPADLFVMVSNFLNDRVEEIPSRPVAHSYCGIQDQRYPDRRAMGFPFDRLARRNVQTIDQFLLPNMAAVNVTIYHSDVTVVAGER